MRAVAAHLCDRVLPLLSCAFNKLDYTFLLRDIIYFG